MKTKEEARANLEASLTYVPDRYRAGISKADWQAKASSDQAEKNYADAVSKAVAGKKRQAQIKKVSNADWQEKAMTKGGAVIAERMRASLDKQAQNWGGVYDQVVGTVQRLAPRTTDFHQNITARLIPTVEAWKKASGKL